MKTYLRYAGLALPVLALAFLLLQNAALAAQGVRAGLAVCLNSVIPSLFVFLVLSEFCIKSGLCALLGAALAPVMRTVFRLPGDAGGVVLMSLIGGFPVGLRMTCALLAQERLTKAQAARMSLFCVNAGPAFVIGAVGTGLLGSRRAGVVLYAALTLASLLIGFFTRFLEKEPLPKKFVQVLRFPAWSDALVDSVCAAVQAMGSVCAWIILFHCLLALTQLLPLPQGLQAALFGAVEVTAGSAATAALGSLPLTAAVLGWCGLCVHCQLLAQLRQTGQRYWGFLFGRLCAAALAGGICMLLQVWFPVTLQVFANGVTAVPQAFSVSAPVATALLVTGGLLIYDLDVRRKT